MARGGAGDGSVGERGVVLSVVVALCLPLAGLGCASPPVLVIWGPGTAAVGEPTTFEVSRGQACGGKVFGGPSDPTGALMVCPPSHDLTRQFTKTVPVRVVSIDDVVSGELRLVATSDGIDQEIAQIGPAPSTLWYPRETGGILFDGDSSSGAVKVRPLLTLGDGSQVYGGAGLFVSDHPDVLFLSPPSAGINLLQQTELPLDTRSVGSAALTASVGAASMTWPLTVVSPPARP